MNTPIRKDLKALKGELADNRIRMVASTTGNPDRMGDVIMPGAFAAAVLRQSTQDGWMDLTHEWELPIGMVHEAKIVGDQLVMECEFHSTDDAQKARTVVMERLQAGKSVSVSIGFMPDYQSLEWFGTGAELLKWAEEEGYDLTLLDQKGIRKQGVCRAIRKVSELFEVSICPVGMNPRAKAIEAKGETAQEQFDEALDAFVLAIEREADITALRARVGKAQCERLSKAVDALLPLFATSDPAPETVVKDDATHDPEREARLVALMSRADTAVIGAKLK